MTACLWSPTTFRLPPRRSPCPNLPRHRHQWLVRRPHRLPRPRRRCRRPLPRHRPQSLLPRPRRPRRLSQRRNLSPPRCRRHRRPVGQRPDRRQAIPRRRRRTTNPTHGRASVIGRHVLHRRHGPRLRSLTTRRSLPPRARRGPDPVRRCGRARVGTSCGPVNRCGPLPAASWGPLPALRRSPTWSTSCGSSTALRSQAEIQASSARARHLRCLPDSGDRWPEGLVHNRRYSRRRRSHEHPPRGAIGRM